MEFYSKEFEKIKIPEVEIPDKYQEELLEYGKNFNSYLESQELEPYLEQGEGMFRFRALEDVIKDGPKLPYWFFNFKWYNKFNEVIGGLNLIIGDLIILKNNSKLLPGSSKDRINLYTNSFFNEFYKIKELFNIYTKKCYQGNLINKKELEEIRESFYEVFKGMLKFRNQQVHQILDFNSQEYDDLSIIDAMQSQNKIISEQEPLSKICEDHLKIYSDQGEILSKSITMFMELIFKRIELDNKN